MKLRTIGNPGGGHIVRQRDEERVLLQIANGEVLAGPEGARIIAARHQAAYGDVWDDAWTRALKGGADGG